MRTEKRHDKYPFFAEDLLERIETYRADLVGVPYWESAKGPKQLPAPTCACGRRKEYQPGTGYVCSVCDKSDPALLLSVIEAETARMPRVA